MPPHDPSVLMDIAAEEVLVACEVEEVVAGFVVEVEAFDVVTIEEVVEALLDVEVLEDVPQVPEPDWQPVPQ